MFASTHTPMAADMAAESYDPETPAALAAHAGTIAHDLNNLLTVVLTYGQLLREQIPAGSDESRALAEMLDAASSGATLAKQLVVAVRNLAKRA